MAKIEMTGTEMELKNAIVQNSSMGEMMGARQLDNLATESIPKIRKIVGEIETFENIGDYQWMINGKKISVAITYRNDTGRFYNSVKALKN